MPGSDTAPPFRTVRPLPWIAQFVEDDEVEACKVIGHATLFAAACLGLQPVHQIDHVEEAAACASADEGAGYGDGEVGLASSGAADKDTITALTDDGIDELKDLLRDARITPETWHAFLDDFVDDAELVARIKARSPR